MNQYSGECTCGKSKITLYLPKPLNQYAPRRCDCQFCQQRNIAYLSDQDGKLTITAGKRLKRINQGSNQADFLTCSECEMVIAATIQLQDRLVGALNSQLLSNKNELLKAVIVSPRQLTPQQKFERWQNVWFDILLQEKDNAAK